MERIRPWAVWLLARLAWLLAAILVAFGAAGLVAASDHLPGSAARAELTWAGDTAAIPALDRATDALQRLSDETDTLGSLARQSLTQLIGGDLDGLATTSTDGDAQVNNVKVAADAFRAAVAAVPGIDDQSALRVSDVVRARYDALTEATALTDDLGTTWAGFSARAISAGRLTRLLVEHDTQAGEAARQGAGGHYQAALKQLQTVDATMTAAKALRDRLAGTTDVETLSDWLDRNARYDTALRRLYTALVKAKGVVTSQVRTALTNEQRARAALPANTRGLVVIMGDVAQGGLNQAVIAIEDARGSLGEALDTQHILQAGAALPGD